jgi:orotate phosphoribosyltransferase
LATLLVVLEAFGFLPRSLSRLILRNRLSLVIEALRELGLIEPQIRNQETITDPELLKSLGKHTVAKDVFVGYIQDLKFSEFIDLQGATVDHKNAVNYARVLTTYLKKSNILVRADGTFAFDAVACPKDGSPILAYEFSRLVKKPLLLYPREEKFRSKKPNIHAIFDISGEIGGRKKLLIVDDSTTGGRKVADLIRATRKNGFVVSECLVVFEPQGKNARSLLEELDVTLHSVVQGPAASNA